MKLETGFCKHCNTFIYLMEGNFIHHHTGRMLCDSTKPPTGVRWAELSRDSLRYNHWVGKTDLGPVTMWIKQLWHGWGCRLDLHKMVSVDMPDCYHTHPAIAIRVVLWGGYTEQLENGSFKKWRPGMMGLVMPQFSHRLHTLTNGRFNISLWIRFRITHDIELRGTGWPGGPRSIPRATEKAKQSSKWDGEL